MLVFWLHAGIIAESELVNQHARRVAELAGHASGDELTDSDRPGAGATPPPAGQRADCGRRVEAEGCRPTGRPVVVRRVGESGRQPVGRRRIALAQSPAHASRWVFHTAGWRPSREHLCAASGTGVPAPDLARLSRRRAFGSGKGNAWLVRQSRLYTTGTQPSPGVRRANPGARFGRQYQRQTAPRPSKSSGTEAARASNHTSRALMEEITPCGRISLFKLDRTKWR